MNYFNNILLALCLFAVGCKDNESEPEELVIDFQVILSGEEAPATVVVNNLTKGANTYSWEFLGGTPSSYNSENPEKIIYENSGEYIISLTASNEVDSKTMTKPIEVFDLLMADFEMSVSSTVIPTELIVTNNSIGADSYNWLFEGGEPSQSSNKNPCSIVYNEIGDFQITLEVSANGRTKSLTQSITLTDHIVIESDWYSVEYINPGTYVFKENKSSQVNISYLLLGQSKAIMFDTGSGENTQVDGYRIKNYIDQITELPVTLLLSHFHFDHNQNINEFDNVGFPALDFLQQNVSGDNIYSFSEEELFLGNTPAQVEVNEWLPLNQEIDLGDKTIELINIPGHTDESVAIIDKTNKLVFLGDYLYNGGLFVFDLDKYEESVDYLIDNIPSDFRLYGAHGSPEIPHSHLTQLKSAIVQIKNGECSFQNTTVFDKPVQVYSCEGIQIILFI